METAYGADGLKMSEQSSFSSLGNLFSKATGFLGRVVENVTDPTLLQNASSALIGSISAVFTAALSVCTFGCLREVNSLADQRMKPKYSKNILPNVYLHVITSINPYGNFSEVSSSEQDKLFISSMFGSPFFRIAKDAAQGDTLFNKHFVSRGYYALAGLVSLVTKTADLALGLLAAVFSIIPGFSSLESVNKFAFNQLGALSLVDDLCRAVRGVINPQQFCVRGLS